MFYIDRKHPEDRPALWPGLVVTPIALLIGITYPPAGVPLAMFAGWLLVRGIGGASRPRTLIQPADISAGLERIPNGRAALASLSAVGMLAAVWTLPGALDVVQWISAPAIVTLLVVAGLREERRIIRADRDRADWTPRLATMFGVAPAIIEQQAGVTPRTGGGVVVDPVPAAVAAKLGNRAAIDSTIAQVEPALMLSEDSSPSRVVLPPVDAATVERRAATAASGGLVEADVEDGAVTDLPPGLVLGEEDLR